MQINVVMVKTQHSNNVGAAARAMANMGGHRLILVDPQCEINSESRQGAAGAQAWLARRRSYSNWEEFYKFEGAGVRIGLTCRAGKTRQVLPLAEVLTQLPEIPAFQEDPQVYLFFGPEDAGLDAEALAMTNYNCELPI